MGYRTALHVLLGAVLTVGLVFTGFSAIIGGAVTGYLEGTSISRGTAAGVLACLLGSLAIVGVAGFGHYGTSPERQVFVALYGGTGLIGSVFGAGLRRIRLETAPTAA